jgi:hypothetical protein
MAPAESDGAWAFRDPPDAKVVTCWRILRGEEWIHFVSHEEGENGWRFQPSLLAPESESAVVALKTVVALDSSLVLLSDLPAGWCAWRDGRTAPWQRAKKEPRTR